MKRIFFNKGVAHERKGLDKINVESIDVQSQCDDCGFTGCDDDCAVILTDLSTGDKYVLFYLAGVFSKATYANWLLYKASGDTDDLSATAV